MRKLDQVAYLTYSSLRQPDEALMVFFVLLLSFFSSLSFFLLPFGNNPSAAQYVESFLLTYRSFLDPPDLASNLMVHYERQLPGKTDLMDTQKLKEKLRLK